MYAWRLVCASCKPYHGGTRAAVTHSPRGLSWASLRGCCCRAPPRFFLGRPLEVVEQRVSSTVAQLQRSLAGADISEMVTHDPHLFTHDISSGALRCAVCRSG